MGTILLPVWLRVKDLKSGPVWLPISVWMNARSTDRAGAGVGFWCEGILEWNSRLTFISMTCTAPEHKPTFLYSRRGRE